MNNLNVIVPYKWEGMWVFDDPRVGLDKEPFVSGADKMIEDNTTARNRSDVLRTRSAEPADRFNCMAFISEAWR